MSEIFLAKKAIQEPGGVRTVYQWQDGCWVYSHLLDSEDEAFEYRDSKGLVKLGLLAHPTIMQLNSVLKKIPHDKDRLEVLSEITKGICTYCGEVVGERICHCQNDE